MDRLFNPLTIRGQKISNRICIPAMVCSTYSDSTGRVYDKHIDHYRQMAIGGAGLIIQEATSVSDYGRVTEDQLGAWSDDHIEGLKKIADAVHGEKGKIVVQLCHGGVVAIEEQTFCPSEYTCTKGGRERTGIALNLAQLKQIQNDFINAAVRAWKAGYDGIELHGCHRYLISQFYNYRVNKRQDAYGSQPSRFALEIIDGIRKNVGPEFIIGMRLGGFEPTLQDGIENALELERHGIDFLDISYGCTGEFDTYVPDGYPFKDIIYAADAISHEVSVPVFGVYGIRTPEQAERILENTGISMVDIGRASLVNPNWSNDALFGNDVGSCLECKTCFWHVDPSRCPGRKLLQRSME